MCRYFLAVDGDEIAVVFQEVQANNETEAKQLREKLADAPSETLLNLYNWNDTHTDSLKRHFGNWFDSATRALTK